MARLGLEAKIYYGAPGAALSAMTELSNVSDVTMNLEAGSADVTTRANNGWRATLATLREASVEFNMFAEDGDAGLEAIRDAFLGTGSDRQVELAVLDRDKDLANVEGLKATFNVTNFTRSEPLEEGISYAVTCELLSFDQYVGT